jgi:RNA polymerase sigma-70 factor (ECF subfamily)
MPYSDEQILTLLGAEHTYERGFCLLITQYKERLYWHIRRMVLVHQDADDVLQNTFIKINKGIHRFEGNSKLYTWLYRIATNEAITHLKNRHRNSTVSLDEGTPWMATQLSADPWFDGDTIQHKLQEAIAHLPNKQKMVFNLRYYQEMPYEEMSELLGTSVGALKASFHHAAKKIEMAIQNND